MSKNKTYRYEALKDLSNVLEATTYKPDAVSPHRGRWSSRVFCNHNPIILELACGKGDYTLELARRNSNKNFIGVDVKGDRIWKGAVAAHEEAMLNVRFLRIYIDHICNYFTENEIDEIWITFPDPYLSNKKADKRLTSAVFLERYRHILKQGGRIHLKTDDLTLFNFTLEQIKAENLKIVQRIDDVHNTPATNPDLDILTYYERMHLLENRAIRYVCFTL